MRFLVLVAACAGARRLDMDDGTLIWELAEKRGKDFGTTHSTGPATVNVNLLAKFIELFQEDRARRDAPQGVPQVLRGGVRFWEAGAQARARPDVLLQEEMIRGRSLLLLWTRPRT